MKRLIFVGAGQMSGMAGALVNENEYEVIGFADNAPALQGSYRFGLPVFSVEEAVAQAPDAMLLTVAGRERARQLRLQLAELGYTGKVGALWEYARMIDIRGGVLTHLAERLRDVPGDLAELGVYRGDFAAKINRLFPQRRLYLFDTFAGFDARDVETESREGFSRASSGEFADTSLEAVLARMDDVEMVIPRKGYFPDTARGLETRFAFVSLDADLYEPTLAGLQFFYPRMNAGGVLLLHDYSNTRFSGVRAAVDAYERENGRLLLLPVADLHGSVMIVKP